ncbi:Protein phosphatase methylesterase 1 [Ascosphaera pollenicola]|nr:Protein phosphatase methylesterase 1 [Ascosphaera pollenicola]
MPWRNIYQDPESPQDSFARGRTLGGQNKKKQGNHESNREQSDDTDERTRLLGDHEQGHRLSPDDPAVTLYNIWGIRALRGFTGFLLVLAALWWLIVFINIFVTLPGLSFRGSGFFALSYATLSIGSILVGLIFFAVPSLPMTIWSGAMTFFLFVNLLLIVLAPETRKEEGWVGITSVAAAFALSIYLLLQTRSVKWGKRAEEERLTGREERRRPLKEWLAVLVQVMVMVVLVAVPILLMSTLSLRARDASLKPHGERYWVQNDRFQVHLHCVGNENASTPTVLVEGGESPVENGMEQWIDHAYQLNKIERYCTWDRPGIAWSDNAPSPFSAGMSADILSEALALAGEDGPYVAVSAGIGGIYSRIFASRHSAQVKGIMLVDTVSEDYYSKVGGAGRGFKLWLRGVFSPLGIDRLSGAIFKGRTRKDRVCGRNTYQGDRFLKAALQENLVANSMTRSSIDRADEAQDLSTPLVVIASGIETGRDKKWAKSQEDLKRVTHNLVSWKSVKGAPHEVWKHPDGMRVLEEDLEKLVKSNK